MNGFQMNFLFSLGHPGYAHASGTVLEGLDAGVNSSWMNSVTAQLKK